MHKVNTNFVYQPHWKEFRAGVDVGHVSSATAACLAAVDKDGV
jgi:hypothetical protein